ncbi:MAG: response regulator [Clostridium sp.]|nr:response regulator [Clostridium sp.]
MKEWLFVKIRYVALALVLTFFVVFGAMSILSILEMSGHARVVNYAGIVRGGSQKLFKMEMFAYYTDPTRDLEMRDKLMVRLDNIIESLSNGGLVVADEKTLIQMQDPIFQADMAKIRLDFGEIKREIAKVRKGDTPDRLYQLTEAYFDLCNRTVGDSENFAQKQVNENIIVLVVVNTFLILLVIGVAIIMRRANKNSQRAEKMAKMAQDAERENRAKSSFLANMSHEIRTPLNVIIGMALVANRSDDAAKVQSSVQEILKASNHLLEVVNDILDMSKIESGKLELAREPFHLRQAIAETSHLTKAKCDEKNLRFVDEIGDETDVWVLGDKTRFNQILLNLLSNAVKFTHKGGVITLSATGTTEDERLMCRIAVSDTGIGLSQEQIDKLFRPFSQASESITGKYGGTGLGLAISQNLLREMGGDLRVDSRLGEGAAFSFEIPFETTKAVQTQNVELSLPDLTGKRILIVDDVDVNRMMLAAILEETRIEAEEADDGTEALLMIQESPEFYYDIVFMDTRMPKMDGYETTKQLRALSRTDIKTMPIISMSANAFREDIEAALAAGMNDHVLKPVELGRLTQVLTKYLVDVKVEDAT